MTLSTRVRIAAAVLAAVAGLLFLKLLGPLQWATVFVYAGLLLILIGAAGLVLPGWILGVRRRRYGAAIALMGFALAAVSLSWPSRTHHSAGSGPLDSFMPDYDFAERHEMRILAQPETVMGAVREVTFGDIGAFETLGKIRNVAMLHSAPVQVVKPVPKPMVSIIAGGSTGFFPLADREREFVFGMAGQPWNNRAVRLKAETFREWMPEGQVKIAANLLVEDAGGGASRLISETRVQATDAAARRIMARYWRLIYPGSAMIRKSLLHAVRERAEGGGR
jgi:hypothetical protein